MQTKYIYNGQDITIDILFKIEDIASTIAAKENVQFEIAYLNFLNSDVYKTLRRTNNLMWAESAGFIADEYYREKQLSPPL